jgi:hypothetical protein
MRCSIITQSVMIAAIGTFLIGCGGDGGPSEPKIPDYHDLPTTNLPASRMLNVPLRSGYGPYCYIQSLSAMLAYLDPSSTEAEVFTYAGFGAALSWATTSAPFNGALVPGPFAKPPDFYQVTLLQNYGARQVVGWAGPVAWLPVDGAVGRITFGDATEALTYLKAAVASGRPVGVWLDQNLLLTECRLLAAHPEDCDGLTGSVDSWLVVTGYDETSIYLNDAVWPGGWGHPTDPRDPRFKNIKTPVGEFMTAWEKPREFGSGTPWFVMLFFEQTSGSQLNKKSVAQILAWQKELSENVVSNIDAAAASASDLTNSQWDRIATMKRLFGDYLSAHGYAEAGALYRSMADDYDSGMGMSAAEARTLLTTVIRPKEVEVRSKY